MKSGKLSKIFLGLLLVVFILLSFLFVFIIKPVDNFDKFKKELMYILNNFEEQDYKFSFGYDEVEEKEGVTLINASIFAERINARYEANDNVITLSKEKKEVKIDLLNGENSFYENQLLINYNAQNNQMISLVDVSETFGFKVTYLENEISLYKEFATARLIIKSSKTPQEFGAVASASGFNNYYIYQYKSSEECKEAYSKYKELDFVEWVNEDAIVTVCSDEITQSSKEYVTWGAEHIGVDDYTNYLTNKYDTNLKDVVVAVLDTGIDKSHTMFNGRLIDGVNFSDDANMGYSYKDLHGHGTHVSGTIVDLTLPNVKILPIKVMDDSGFGYSSAILLGIQHAINLKNEGTNVVAINMSFGSENGFTQDDYDNYYEGITEAYSEGIISIVAAGNKGVDVKGVTPANIESAITVGAIGITNDQIERPNWSNYGEYVDVVAPGVDIESAGLKGENATKSGTSMATPHVSGAVALICSDPNKNYSVQDIENILTSSAIDLGVSGKDAYYGYGLINIEYAYATIMDMVEFSVNESNFESPFELLLTSNDKDAVIYYTLDGTEPSLDNGNIYSAPISIEKTTIVKAIAYILDDGQMIGYSHVKTMIYNFNNTDIDECYVVDSNGLLTEYKGIMTELHVPSSVNGITVLGIGSNAFASSKVKRVTLAGTITTIENSAFIGCKTLEYISGFGVQKIGMSAFENCYNITKLTDEEFPALTEIDKYAFLNCYKLKEISLSKLEVVDSWVFAIEEVVSNEVVEAEFASLRVVRENAFSNRTSLENIVAPNLEIICSYAFSNCNFIKVKYDNCKIIGNFAFVDNSNITNIELWNVEVIGKSAFAEIKPSLKTIMLTMPSVKRVYSSAFYSSKITSIDMPIVEYVGSYAFAECGEVEYVYIPNVKYLGVYSLKNINKITELELHNVVELKRGAVICSNLSSVILSNCIEVLEEENFNNVSSGFVLGLYSGTVAENYAENLKITYNKIDNTSCLQYVVSQGGVEITGNSGVSSDYIIPAIIDGKKVISIKSGAFAGANISSLNLPYVVNIGDGAFANCVNLKSITLKSIENIGNNAFEGCVSLVESDIENVVTVGDFAFRNTMLYSVKLIKIENVGEKAFGYDAINNSNSQFMMLGYEGVVKEYAEANNLKFATVFKNIPYYYYNYYYVDGVKEIYIDYADRDFAGNLILPSEYNGFTVSKIGGNAFAGCSQITGIYLPESIKILEESAFRYCVALKTINLENVTVIGNYAFAGCGSLSSVNLKCVELSKYAFYDCENLVNVYAENLQKIGDYAFAYCYSLVDFYASQLLEIGECAFSHAFNLKNINLSNVTILGTMGVGSIKGKVFMNCYSLKEIRLPKIVSLGELLFNGSGVERVVIGKSLYRYSGTPIVNTIDVYGYWGTFAETMSKNIGNDFVPIDEHKITQDLLNEVRGIKNSELKLEINSEGYDIKYGWYKTDTGKIEDGELIAGVSSKNLTIDTSVAGTTYYYVVSTDWSGSIISNVCKCEVVENENVFVVDVLAPVDKCIISPVGENIINKGDDIEITFNPNPGYVVDKIVIDGVEFDVDGNSYVIKNVQNNHQVYVIVKPLDVEYKVLHWIEQLHATPKLNEDTFYSLFEEEECFGLVDTETSGSFKNIVGFEGVSLEQSIIKGDGSTVINLYYNRMMYSVYVERTDGVSVISGEGNYKFGQEVSVSASLKDGYKIVSWQTPSGFDFTEDGVSIKFNMPAQDVEIEVVTEIQTFKLIVATSQGGSSDISGEIVLNFGEQKTITFEELEGYTMQGVYLNGESIGDNKSISITIVKDTIVFAEFSKIIYNVSMEVMGAGEYIVEGANNNKVEYGNNLTIEFMPDEGYEIDKVYLNDVLVEVQDNVLEITKVTSDVRCKVVYKELTSEEGSFENLDLKTIIIIGVGVLIVVITLIVFVVKTTKKNKRI